MPNDQRIDSIIDSAKVQAEIDQMIDGLNKAAQVIKDFPDVSKAYKDSGSAAELKKNTEDIIAIVQKLKKSFDELTVSVQQYQNMVKQQIEVQLKANAAQAEAAKQYGAASQQLKQQTQDTQNFARAQQLAQATLQQMGAQLQAMTEQYEKMDEAQRDTTGGEALLQQIKEQTEALQQLETEIASFASDMESCAQAITTLQNALQEVKTKMDAVAEAAGDNSEELAKLVQEYELLNAIVGNQAVGFTSMSMELSVTSKHMESMSVSGQKNTEVFKTMQKVCDSATVSIKLLGASGESVGNAKDKLEGLSVAAQGLSGAYSIAAGAASLFGGGSKELEEALSKLSAVMDIANGVEELYNAWQERSKVATFLREAAEKAVAVAIGIKNFVMTGSIAATEANAAATVVNTGATEATAVATTVATGAMIAFRAAIVATGIGALVIGLMSLMGAFSSSSDAAGDFNKSIDDLKDSDYEAADVLKSFGDTADEIAENTLKKLNEGVDQFQDSLGGMVDRSRAAQGALKLLKDEADNFKKALDDASTPNQIQDLLDKLKRNHDEQEQIKKVLAEDKVKQDKANSLEKELKDAVDAAKQKNDVDISAAKAQAKNQKEAEDATYNIQLKGQNDKLNLLAKYLQQAKNLGDKVLSDRIKKEQDAVNSSITVMQNNHAYEQNQKDWGQKAAPVHSGGGGGSKVKENYTNDKEQAKDRETNADSNLHKIGLEEQKKPLKEIIDDENKSFAERLSAMKSFAGKSIEQVQEDGKMELLQVNEKLLKIGDIEKKDATKRTADEKRLLIEKKALLKEKEVAEDNTANRIADINKDLSKQIADEGRKQWNKEFEDERKETEAKNASDMKGIYEKESQAINDLNKQLDDGTISYSEYQKAKQDITDDTTNKSLEEEKKGLEDLMDTYDFFGADTTELEKKLGDVKKKISDDTTKHIMDNGKKEEDAHKKNAQKFKESAKEAENIVSSIVEGGFKKRLDQIQTQIDANAQWKQAELDRINSSTLSEQDKANKIAQINATAKAKDDQLNAEKKEEQLKQAKFERAKSLFDVAIKTAQAIAEAVADSPTTGGLPFSAIAAGIGAAQAAAILSQPLPKFSSGTSSSPEGFALTDEKGPELYIEPSGKMYMGSDEPNIKYLKRDTEIIPYDKVNDVLLGLMLKNTAKNFHVDNSSKKIDELKETLIWHAKETGKHLAKNKSRVVNNIRVDTRWGDYLQKNVYE